MIFKVNLYKETWSIPSPMMKNLINGSLSMLVILTDITKFLISSISLTETNISSSPLNISILTTTLSSSVKMLGIILSQVLWKNSTSLSVMELIELNGSKIFITNISSLLLDSTTKFNIHVTVNVKLAKLLLMLPVWLVQLEDLILQLVLVTMDIMKILPLANVLLVIILVLLVQVPLPVLLVVVTELLLTELVFVHQILSMNNLVPVHLAQVLVKLVISKVTVLLVLPTEKTYQNVLVSLIILKP